MSSSEYGPILKLLFDLLAGALSPNSPLSAAKELYNEGSLLRIALALESNGIHCLPFHFAEGARWQIEPLLYSPFQAKFRGDKQSERHTHADGVVGNVTNREGTIRGLKVLPNAKQFIVIESKLFSGLSSGTTNAAGYDQAVRNVVCMAKALEMSQISADAIDSLGFYVIAPKSRVAKHESYLKPESMARKVEARISAYPEDLQESLHIWRRDWFDPLIKKATIKTDTWEAVIERAKSSSQLFGDEFEKFYKLCLGPTQSEVSPEQRGDRPLPEVERVYRVDGELVLVTGARGLNCRVVPVEYEGPYFPRSKMIETDAFGEPVTPQPPTDKCRPLNGGKYLWFPPETDNYCPPNETTQPVPPCVVVVSDRGRGTAARVQSTENPERSFLVYPHHLLRTKQ